jgi:hypothetical protein
VRLLCWVIACAACEPPLALRPLPPLAPPVAAGSIERVSPLVIAGEALAWDVRVAGFTVGRAELVVDADGGHVRSRFATSALASSFAHVRHDLVTATDEPRGVARSIHGALAAVRRWAAPGAPPAYLALAFDGVTYRLALGRPIAEELHGEPALRIEGKLGEEVAFTLWLGALPARAPLRFEARAGDQAVTAERVGL